MKAKKKTEPRYYTMAINVPRDSDLARRLKRARCKLNAHALKHSTNIGPIAVEALEKYVERKCR